MSTKMISIRIQVYATNTTFNLHYCFFLCITSPYPSIVVQRVTFLDPSENKIYDGHRLSGVIVVVPIDLIG